ncbi:hypothetical protein GGI02_002853 [Coemansia sp. RSA 2322]|nr:hypothetical protein GGI02_002853 [Coemansia sp. RSA 2322]
MPATTYSSISSATIASTTANVSPASEIVSTAPHAVSIGSATSAVPLPSHLMAATPALSASSEPPASSLSMADYYNFTTSSRPHHSTNDSSAASGLSTGDMASASSGFDDHMQNNWMQAFISQHSALYQTPTDGYGFGQGSGSPSTASAVVKTEFQQQQSSDSDSDEISKSISYFLGQQLNQQPPQGSSGPAAMHFATRQQPSGLMVPHSSGGGDYGAALRSMLEMGYDGGSRVISMPNPLDSLALDIPIHPPPPPPVPPQAIVQPVLGLLPGPLMMGAKDSAAALCPPSMPAGSGMPGILGFSHPEVPFAVTPGTADSLPSLIGSCGSGAAQPAAPVIGRSALGIITAPGKRVSAHLAASAAKRSASAGGSAAPKSGGSVRARRGRLSTTPAAELRRAGLAEAAVRSGGESPSCGSPVLSSSASSALIPHRVDRQLAAASRPLFFVRPRASDEQPRRRKRRCVSSGGAGAFDDACGAAAAAEGGDGAEEPSLQWQRISEQRRRDAMRENFDLLKRMMPQGYMASDDGRELARPVLLARFLRWVDDTLIEMEALKSEVASLRLGLPPAVAELWPPQAAGDRAQPPPRLSAASP